MSRALLSDLSGLLLFVRTDMMPRRRGSKKGLPVAETSMPMKDALRILVLEDGKIAEQGDHDDLIARGGRYSEMFELQAASYR